MYTTKLEVVNACLATLGEAPITALTDNHIFKQNALDYLTGSVRATLKRGLWFNTETLELKPDAASKYIYIPGDSIAVKRLEGGVPFSQRGRRLYDPIYNRYEWDNAILVEKVTLLDFEDCPFFAQDAISLDAVLRFQKDFDGDNARYQQINMDRQRANLELNAQHTREIKANLLYTNATIGKIFAVSPDRNYNGPRLGIPGRY